MQIEVLVRVPPVAAASSLHGDKYEKARGNWRNLLAHRGSFVDARTGKPYSSDYCHPAEVLDFLTNDEWSRKDEETWSEKAQRPPCWPRVPLPTCCAPQNRQVALEAGSRILLQLTKTDLREPQINCEALASGSASFSIHDFECCILVLR